MIRRVLFVHGAGRHAHDHWDNRLVDSLRSELGPDYNVHYPVMPNGADPQYFAWKQAIERDLAALEPRAVVIGHSVGGTILINALAERTPQSSLGAICLISAPFIGAGWWESDDIEPRSDLATRVPRDVPIFLYHGLDDDTVPIAYVDLYARSRHSAHVRRLANRDHQLNNDLSEVASDIRQLGSDSKLE